MTLRKKILLGFIVCASILLMVAVFSFRNSEKLISTNKWVNHTYAVLFEFEQMRSSSINAETSMRGYVITGNEQFLAPFNNSKISIFEHLKTIKTLTSDNLVQQKNIAPLVDICHAKIADLELKIELRKHSFNKSKELIASGEGERLQNEIRSCIDKGQVIEQILLRRRVQASEADLRNFNIVFFTLLITIILVLVMVYVFILYSLDALKLAELGTADKNWVLAGSGNLIKDMQGNKQIQELAQTVIGHLATYLNAQVGAIYITEADGAHLALASTYANGLGLKAMAQIKIGDGIAGQAAASSKAILLTDIPNDYFNLNSAFGTVKPKNIIAIPFLFEGQVIGVIELGCINHFTPLQQQYLQIVVNSIAIAIVSAKIREQTRELLEETQRQAEELEVQQEELRQANEELLAKTEMLQDSEGELKAQQQELRQTNEELEEKATLLEEQKGNLLSAKEETETKAKELEVTSKYKSEFLANMSHELRTPLNSILILSQLLAENRHDKLAPKEVEFAQNIYSSGNDLLNLINEILDLSKVEAGKMELEVGVVPLQSIVSNVTAMFEQQAKNNAITFTAIVNEKAVAPNIISDRQRIEQILKNLLSNAFKFTPKKGSVSLTVGAPRPGVVFKNNALAQSEKIIAISVIDTGIGIPAAKQSVIFEAFQQADGSTKRKYGGTGLGLSISRELAGILGGEIQLESEEGRGSTFILYLPPELNAGMVHSETRVVTIKEAAQVKESTITPYNGPDAAEAYTNDDRNNITGNDRVILIIEDDDNFARLLLDFVRERNYKGIIAGKGSTGVSMARHYKPAAILLDMELPVMNGSEVLRQIKNDPGLRHIPIQILSAYDHRKESMALGAFDYIFKPVTNVSLRRALDKLETFVNKMLKKLLIVEDNRLQNNAISELISNNEVQCFAAYTGGEALNMMEQEIFDCVIVDLGLPDMSGFHLLEEIKRNGRLNHIPVIVYTGKDLTKEENTMLAGLADTVVLKTANSQERLLDETVLFLHQVESKLSKEKQNIIRKLHRKDDIFKNKRVLLVDDDIRNIYSLSNVLQDEDIVCIIAENGKAALSALKEHPNIDLVLMDIMMPEMDGYEATIAIRKMTQYARLPIIALTAKAMVGDKEKCLAAGMSDYISKPVNVEQLLSLMKVWLYK